MTQYRGRQQGKMYRAQIKSNNTSLTSTKILYKLLNAVLSTLLFAITYNVTIADDELTVLKWQKIVGLMLLTGLIANIITRLIIGFSGITTTPHGVRVFIISTFLYSLLLLFGIINWIFENMPVFATGIDESLIYNICTLLLFTKICVWIGSTLTAFTLERWLNN